MGSLSAFFMNRRIVRARKDHEYVVAGMLEKTRSVQQKKDLIGLLARLPPENAVWALEQVMNVRQPAEVQGAVALALKAMKWDAEVAAPDRLLYHAVLDDWAACARVFRKNPEALNASSLGIGTCRRILDRLASDGGSEGALASRCIQSRVQYKTIYKDHPDSILYPYTVIAWASTGARGAVKDLLCVAPGAERVAYIPGRVPDELKRAFDEAAPRARELLHQLGAEVIPEILRCSFQGTAEQAEWGDLSMPAEDAALRLGEKALPSLERFAQEHQADEFGKKAREWMTLIREGTKPRWS